MRDTFSLGDSVGYSPGHSMGYSMGYSMIELLVSTSLVAVVAAGAFGMLNPSSAAFQSQLEAADMQQRLRVAATRLAADLAVVGAGPDRGPRAGPLVQSFAPVLPMLRGTRADDPPESWFADRITLLAVPPGAPQTRLSAAVASGSDWIVVDAQPQCPPSDPLCLFSVGDVVAVFDDSGSIDLVEITAVAASPVPMLQHANQPLTSTAYQPSTTSIVGMSVVSYALDRQASQLVVVGGLGAPVAPFVDNVVDLAFTYHALGDDGSFVPLTAAQLADGPWRPNASSANRWDADLLRVRAVTVTLRVQAAIAALRGPAGALFAAAGTGRDASRWVPDTQVTFQISPRNLDGARTP
jgi:Tfp pilus assembly protein PilW